MTSAEDRRGQEDAEALVTELERLDVRLSTRAGTLVCSAPAGVLRDEHRRRIKQLKPWLLVVLEARRAGERPASDEPPPLSRSQARIRSLATLLPESSAAGNIGLGFRLAGALEPESLTRAIDALVRRHEALRSCGGPGAHLVVRPESELEISRHDLRAEPDRAVRLRSMVDALASSAFDLGVAPLLRVSLFRLADQEWVLLLVTHVFAFDGRSTPLLLDDLGDLYAKAVAGHDLKALAPAPRYSDFAPLAAATAHRRGA